jgi:hypothetical protein
MSQKNPSCSLNRNSEVVSLHALGDVMDDDVLQLEDNAA